jgi:hypothetical protein
MRRDVLEHIFDKWSDDFGEKRAAGFKAWVCIDFN